MRRCVPNLLAIVLLAACHRDAPSATAEPDATSAPSAPSATASASAAPAPSVTASAASPATASASASAAPPRRVACGATTCAPRQYCLHYDPSSGGAYDPQKRPADATMCSDTITRNDSMNCGPPNAARQSFCTASIPRAPPHGE